MTGNKSLNSICFLLSFITVTGANALTVSVTTNDIQHEGATVAIAIPTWLFSISIEDVERKGVITNY